MFNKPSLRRLLLICTGITFGLFSAEVLVCTIRPQPPFSTSTEPISLNRGRFTTPGSYQNKTSEFSVDLEVNKHGFVDWEWTLPNPNSTLLIGDSFVQGAQVEMNQSIGRELQSLINKPVYSIGVPGAGTTTSLLLLKEWVPKL